MHLGYLPVLNEQGQAGVREAQEVYSEVDAKVVIALVQVYIIEHSTLFQPCCLATLLHLVGSTKQVPSCEIGMSGGQWVYVGM